MGKQWVKYHSYPTYQATILWLPDISQYNITTRLEYYLDLLLERQFDWGDRLLKSNEGVQW